MLCSYDGHPINFNEDVEVEQHFALCFVLKNGNSTKIDKMLQIKRILRAIKGHRLSRKV